MKEAFEQDSVVWERVFPDEGKRAVAKKLVEHIAEVKGITRIVAVDLRLFHKVLVLADNQKFDLELKFSYERSCWNVIHGQEVLVNMPEIFSEAQFIKMQAQPLYRAKSIVTLWEKPRTVS